MVHNLGAGQDDDDFGVTSEDTEILNLPLYTERKADGIYRYRRTYWQ